MVENSPAEHIDTLKVTIYKIMFALSSHTSFILCIGKEGHKVSEDELMGMNAIHYNYIKALKSLRATLQNVNTKEGFIDRLDELTRKIEYVFTSNTYYLEHISNNSLDITEADEMGLVYRSDEIIEELNSYTNYLKNI